jgi:hypothetical protein
MSVTRCGRRREHNMVGRMLLAVGVAALGVHLWHAHQQAVFDAQLSALEDVDGFLPIPMGEGAPRNAVIILAPVNCPSDGAKRADALARYLNARGVPNVRMTRYTIGRVTRDMQSDIQRANAVLSGTWPVVVIDGRGKANPTADQVIDEYQNDRS